MAKTTNTNASQGGKADGAIACSKCHRPLKDPASIARGMGPVCSGTSSRARRIKPEAEQMKFELGPPVLPDVIICSTKEGECTVNVPQWIVKHSPTGFAWGYQGSGPADLALNIVAAVIGREAAERNGIYQEFKRTFISDMPKEGGKIYKADVITWLKGHGYDIKEA